MKEKASKEIKIEPCIVIHGGAGVVPQSREAGKINGVKKATYVGYKELIASENALNAVEKAVNVMEMNGYFNAGYGSVLTCDGTVECDASIQCGRTMNFGAVSIVKDILYPISLARVVMQKSRHKNLSEDATIKFARENGVRILHPPGQLVTDFISNAMENLISEELKNKHSKGNKKTFETVDEGGTVGAVAIDIQGNIAVATSTGGISQKWSCRIGDTACIGSGTYCDNKVAGISTTGNGDILMRACLAADVVKRMDYLKEDIQTACENSCKRLHRDFKGTCGCIGIDREGNIGVHFSSQRMAWAFQKGTKIHFGIRKKDDYVQEVKDEDFESDNEE